MDQTHRTLDTKFNEKNLEYKLYKEYGRLPSSKLLQEDCCWVRMMGKAAVGEITSPSPPVGGEEGDDRWKSDAGDVKKWEE